MQQDNDPKHTSKSTLKYPKKRERERERKERKEGAAKAQSKSRSQAAAGRRNLFINESLQTSMDESNVAKKSVPEFLKNDMKD